MSRRKRILLWSLLIVIGLPVALLGALAGWAKLSDKTNGTIVSSGVARRYLLYVPKSYDASKATPLVVSLHPAAGWPAMQKNMSGWNRLADEHGFIVVYPAGTDFPQVWSTRPTGRDVQFISDLLDKLESSYNIDPARIYVNGMSQGGGMTFLLSCKLAGRIAAVGEVAAAVEHPDSCGDAAPVPVMAFHGTADRFAPYQGGISPVEPPGAAPFPAIREWVAAWARRNQCSGDASEVVVSAHVRRLAYSNCAPNADVVLYIVEGGGHSWPGAGDLPEQFFGSTTHEIDATRLLWEFYVQHPRSPER
jgi:polyhydroxybutyrate depolymerase